MPKPDTRRVVTFANEDDRIIFRHHTYDKQGKEIALKVRPEGGKESGDLVGLVSDPCCSGSGLDLGCSRRLIMECPHTVKR